jgi:hypothetical protein
VWCNVLKPKILLRYFVTFYFWISLKHLELCPNKLWGVKCVLYTSVRCRVWVQVQPTKIWAPNLKSELKFNTYIFVSLGIQLWIQFWGIIKMNFSNKHVVTLVSFVGTKFVLCNGAIGCSVWLIINNQLIHQIS